MAQSAVLAIKIVADAAGATKGLDQTSSKSGQVRVGDLDRPRRSPAVRSSPSVLPRSRPGKAAAEDAQSSS